MRLGVFIGSFNPVHKGHIHLVNYLLDNNYVDQILIVATQKYWNKQDLVDIKHRINMLKFFETDKIHIDCEHNDISYTYLLMQELSKKYYHDLYLIMGADNIINFDKWKNYQELLKYKIIIMNRNGIDINKYLEKYNKDNFIVLDNYPSLDLSSTGVRVNNKNEFLDPKVLNYIKKNGLYERNSKKTN